MAAWECSSISSGPGQPILDRVAQASQQTDPGIAGEGEDQLAGRSPMPDHLVVDHVRRHADQGEIAAALADRLMGRGIGPSDG